VTFIKMSERCCVAAGWEWWSTSWRELQLTFQTLGCFGLLHLSQMVESV